MTGNRRHDAKRIVDAAGRERRTIGWEAVHVAIDGFTRLAYAEVLPDEKASTTVGFIRRAIAFYAARGIHVERIHSASPDAVQHRSRG